MHRRGRRRVRRRAAGMTAPEPFTHRIRVRYAEVDGQGVVFNAHWLTYFDETCTRFVRRPWGFGPDFWIEQFDVMLVKAVLEWSGSGRLRRLDRHRGRAQPDRHQVVRPALPSVGRWPAGVRSRDHLRRGRPRRPRVDRAARSGPRRAHRSDGLRPPVNLGVHSSLARLIFIWRRSRRLSAHSRRSRWHLLRRAVKLLP